MRSEVRSPKPQSGPARTEPTAEKCGVKNGRTTPQTWSGGSVVAPAPSLAIVLRAARPRECRQPRRLPHYGSRGGCPTSDRLGRGKSKPSCERFRKDEAQSGGNPKPEIRNQSVPGATSCSIAVCRRRMVRVSDFGLRISFGLRTSDFGFQTVQSPTATGITILPSPFTLRLWVKARLCRRAAAI